MKLTSTHTFAALEVSPACYDEVARLLRAAKYDHCFVEGEGGPIDMSGVALTKRGRSRGKLPPRIRKGERFPMRERT